MGCRRNVWRNGAIYEERVVDDGVQRGTLQGIGGEDVLN